MLSAVRFLGSLRLASFRSVAPGLAPPGAHPAAPGSYGRRGAGVQVLARAFALAAVLCVGLWPSVMSCVMSWGLVSAAAAAEGPVRIVAFGDSLTAGFGLPATAAFPVRL